jgi:hypothetical protein
MATSGSPSRPSQESGATYAVSNYDAVVAKSKFIEVIPPVYLNVFNLKTFKYS